jgi:small multidrug resistance family-3 protein
MLTYFQSIPPLLLLLIATVLEAGGDAIIRSGIYQHGGLIRIGLLIAGGLLLFCYGSLLNLTPLDFGRVVGLYIATLFVVWQVINYIAFRTLPSLPILVGGVLIVVGGAISTYWQPG